MHRSPLFAPQQYPTPVTARRPRRRYASQRLAWLLSSLALTAFAVVPKHLIPQFSLSLSTPSHQQQSSQPWATNHPAAPQTCHTVLNKNQRLSRAQLTQFLSIAQESSQAAIHETIASPYCTLSKAHQAHQQEAYPLAFDPDTWFVINYDQGIYKSYDFVFQK